ncbi:MAG: LysR family transcriptional regulator [Chloroflexi bacterium]|nr:LysR family transcriptional regulator [Chloroflexota bacterium]
MRHRSELRLLRYFLAVVDDGSISRAAATVAVAQPSLSRQLRGLETELGVTLFDRSQRALRLAPAGAAFLPMARDLVARADRAMVTMAMLGDARTVALTLVAPETTVADVIAPFVAANGSDLPAINVREALPSSVFEEVRRGSADLGVSSGAIPATLSTRPVASFPIWAYVPDGHRWAGRARIRVADLVTEPLIVLGPSHGTRRLLDAAVAGADLHYTVVAETNVPQVAQALAAAGRGVAVVSDDGRYGLHGLLITTTRGPLRIPLVAAGDPTHYAATAIKELVTSLAAYAAGRYAD